MLLGSFGYDMGGKSPRIVGIAARWSNGVDPLDQVFQSMIRAAVCPPRGRDARPSRLIPARSRKNGRDLTITTRLAAYLFSSLAGIDAVFVPYKGSAEVVQGLLDGSIQFSVDGVSANLPLVEGGLLRALAKLNNRPLAALPQARHLAVAANMPALGEISTWAGLMAPAGTPPAIIDKIQRSLGRIAADPEVADKLIKVGIVVAATTPKEFADFVREESTRWSRVIKESGIKLDE